MIQIIDVNKEQARDNDFRMANLYAQQFMKKLFKGDIQVRCKCGKPIHWTGRLCCESCGEILDRVSFETDYTDRYIRTVIDVDKKTYELFEADPEDEGMLPLLGSVRN